METIKGPEKLTVSRHLKLAGNILAIAGLLAVALSTIGVWAGKLFGLGIAVTDIFGWMSFAAMMVIISLAMGCFWLADRIDKSAGLKTMAEEADEKKTKLFPWGRK